MQGILRISEAVAIGIHAVFALSADSSKRLSGRELAAGIKASEAHLLKVMRRLVKAGIVSSERGPSGGFAIAKKPESIPLIDIYEAIEGDFPSGACLFATPVCEKKICPLGDFICDINGKSRAYFRKTTIGDLAKQMKGDRP